MTSQKPRVEWKTFKELRGETLGLDVQRLHLGRSKFSGSLSQLQNGRPSKFLEFKIEVDGNGKVSVRGPDLDELRLLVAEAVHAIQEVAQAEVDFIAASEKLRAEQEAIRKGRQEAKKSRHETNLQRRREVDRQRTALGKGGNKQELRA